MDHDTDALMNEIILEEFKDRTVIAVAHKLDSVLDFNRVIVLQEGAIIETGSPRALLAQPSVFLHLWESLHGSGGVSG